MTTYEALKRLVALIDDETLHDDCFKPGNVVAALRESGEMEQARVALLNTRSDHQELQRLRGQVEENAAFMRGKVGEAK